VRKNIKSKLVLLPLGGAFSFYFGHTLYKTYENAQGKTNLMESIYTLAMTKSHRTNQDRELIMWNQDAATIKGKVEKKIKEAV